VYVGVKDVPFIDGLRELMQGKDPKNVSRSEGGYEPVAFSKIGSSSGDSSSSTEQGELGLVGNALKALPKIRAAAPGVELGGRAPRPNNPSSDHPRGLAIDVMTRDNAVAQRVIRAFKGTNGAKYWIWNGRLGHVNRLWVSYPYTKFGGHYDHVHLSWS
jgi:hypothetical protein